MKTNSASLIIICICILLTKGCIEPPAKTIKDYPITPVDFTLVQLRDGFWKERVKTVRDVTIPFSFDKCEETGRVDNFIFAGGIKEGKYRGRYGFNDSDVFKIMEGASYSLTLEDDPAMDTYLDSLIYYISEAQEEDGYLYTPWTLKANDYNEFTCCSYHDEGKWIGTSGLSHEFYNMGHMYEAAVAHFLATGKQDFLDVAIKSADLINDVCITGQNDYVPGHQEIEIGLVKLFRVTSEEKYLILAKHLLDIRADAHEGSYSQAHLPVNEQTEALGHAVRANYMYSAMADVAALTGDSSYLDAIGKIWDNVAHKKLSITGGVGASHQGEAYGENYDLPNHPYNETCAAIANLYWNHRMFLLHGDAKFIDVLERSLYNGVLSGLSLDGTTFFYPNTLQHDGESAFNQGVNGRSPWFDCSCCPSNLSRFIPSVAGYAYAVSGESVYVNLFINSEVSLETDGGLLSISQQSNYPWDGDIQLELQNAKPVEATLHIRIPGWVQNRPVPSDLFTFMDEQSGQPSLMINERVVEVNMENGFATIQQEWKNGDVITLNLPMESRIIVAHKQVEAKTGLAAVQFGPLLYCAEEIDNQLDVLEAGIQENSKFTARFIPRLLGGVNKLQGENMDLVPYYTWANRGIGKMNAWFKVKTENL